MKAIIPTEASPVASGIAMLAPQKAGNMLANMCMAKPTMITTHINDTLLISFSMTYCY